MTRGYRRCDDGGDGADAVEGDDNVTSDKDTGEKLGRTGLQNQRPGGDADSSSTPPVSSLVSSPSPLHLPPPPFLLPQACGPWSLDYSP
jgi:hypothetical protein